MKTVVAVGAAGSLGLMLYAGRRQGSVILILLFAGWVLAPFVAYLVLKRKSAALDVAALIFTLASLAIYAEVAFGHPNVKTGFVFLVVPAVSWLLLLVTAAAARFGRSGKSG